MSGTLLDPTAGQAWQLGITAVALGLLGAGVVRTFRSGDTRLLLMVVASASAFWQETYGDWAAYLTYSPRFAHYAWGDTRWTSPIQCWWFIAGYAVFYPTLYGLLLTLARVVRERRPQANVYVAVTLLALPVFYAFDLIFEGTTTYLGYWTYGYTFGPAVHLGHGTFPLLWPILEQVPFIALAAIALVWRDDRGRDVFHRAVARLRPGPARAAALTGTWIVAVNVTFLALTTLPLMALRWVAGPDMPFLA